MIIGIGNVGSTSLKSKIIDIDENNNIRTLGQANLDKMTSKDESNFSHSVGDDSTITERVDIVGFEAGIKLVVDWFVENGVLNSPQDIEAMGFKTVMGKTNGANLLTPDILQEMKDLSFIAPVHNLPYVETIGNFKKILDIPMVGVFEPSFHYSKPQYRELQGFPWEWYEDLGIKNLGFHGSSHRYMSAAAAKIAGTDKMNLITIHLGGSSSMAAVRDGKSIDTSMGFSPNSGLLQGTRPGNVDSSAVLFAMKQLGLSVDEIQQQLAYNSGLKGTAGIGTEDFRDILEAADGGNKRAKLAVDLFIDGIRKYIGGFATVLGGLDFISFGGGIGEKGAYVREKCLEDLEFMGIKLDPVKNKEMNGKQGQISSDDPDSKVKIYITPTNEEIVVAYFTKRVVEEGRDLKAEEMTFKL